MSKTKSRNKKNPTPKPTPRVPRQVLHLAPICDRDSSRYVLDGINLQVDGERGTAAAADGRRLLRVDWNGGFAGLGAVVHQDVFRALLGGPCERPECVEGRFPKIDDIRDEYARRARQASIDINPRLLYELLRAMHQMFEVRGASRVTLHVVDGALLLEATPTEGVEASGILMELDPEEPKR